MSKYIKLLEQITKDKKTAPKFKEKTYQALEWYNRKINKFLGKTAENVVNPQEFEKKVTQPKKITPGLFYIFGYNPLNKNTLPYYDKFPLVLVLKLVPHGFIGLNMHYIDPHSRAIFMDRLYEYESMDRNLGSTKININYNILKDKRSLSYYRPCIKRYYITNIRKFIAKVPQEEWDIFLFMPTEKFQNENKEDVWAKSQTMIKE